MATEARPELARLLRRRGNSCVDWALSLGSGLSSVVELLGLEPVASFADAGLPTPGVPGHAGRVCYGTVGGHGVLAFAGRVHLYEGHDLEAVTRSVRAAATAGATRVLLANAAGGLAPDMMVGDLMIISDHLSLPGLCGYGSTDQAGVQPWPRFTDQDGVYDSALTTMAVRLGQQLRLPVRQGVYAMVGGPQFETPAERELLRRLGADAVGMSTAPEALAAHACGMRVLGVSVITNTATQASAPTHEEVAKASGAACRALADLLRLLLAQDA